MQLKRRIHEILDVCAPGDGASRTVNLSIQAIIILNLVVLVAETVKSIHEQCPSLFHGFDIFSVMVFSVEYLLRLWTCTANPKFAHPFRGRLRFMFTSMALIDLFAVLPFYLPLLGVDLRFVRIFRVFRLFRIIKLARYSSALGVFGQIITARKAELLSSLFIVFTLLVFASSLMYYAENAAQPDRFSSIPAAMWWGVATITTVGYGDIYPVTTLGKLMAAFVSLIGIGALALPTSIFVAGFMDATRKAPQPPKKCPHCSGELKGE